MKKQLLTMLLLLGISTAMMAQSSNQTYTAPISVTVGTYDPYRNESVTYVVRTYTEGGVTKMDVDVPEYLLTNTVMGDLTIGAYTVSGLVYDDAKGGYYRDYSGDGLKAHFKAVSGGAATMDADYVLGINVLTKNPSNILVKTDGNGVTIQNTFALGRMPMDCVSLFTATATAISNAAATTMTAAGDGAAYNIAGQRVNGNARGIVIIDGRKYMK